MTADVRADVDAAWTALLAAGDFVGGRAVEQFERQWADYCGAGEAIGVGNGTDALVLVLRALGIGPGDEVVVPANTFVATAEAVVLVGASPRFADVDPDTLLLTDATAAAALTSRTAAVIAVHLYGRTVDMDAVGALADAAGVPVIEDAAQAHGATWRGRVAGSMGRAGCFSFYPGKNLGAFGDAGAVVTADAELAATVRSLRDHGRVAGAHAVHGLVGTNSRMDTLQAAVLSAKLPHLAAWTARRRSVVADYAAALAGTDVRPVAVADGVAPAEHLAVVRTPRRDAVRAALTDAGIATGLHSPVPGHHQAPYRRYADRALPVVEAAAGEVLSLPLHPHLDDVAVRRVIAALRGAVARSAPRPGQEWSAGEWSAGEWTAGEWTAGEWSAGERAAR